MSAFTVLKSQKLNATSFFLKPITIRDVLIESVKNNINGVRAAISDKLPCVSHPSTLWNLTTGQGHLSAGPKAALCSEQLFAKLPGKRAGLLA